MEDVQPFIPVKYIEIDKQTNQKCCEAHEEQPYHEENIGRLWMFAQFFFLFQAVWNKIDGNHKHDSTHHIAQDDYKQAGSSEPVEHNGSEK